MEECHHWGGEEPYDKARAKEIEDAVKKLNCDSLDSDLKAIKSKYKGNRKVLVLVKSAEDEFQ